MIEEKRLIFRLMEWSPDLLGIKEVNRRRIENMKEGLKKCKKMDRL